MKFMSCISREMNMRPWILNLTNTDGSQLKVKSKGAYFLVSTLKKAPKGVQPKRKSVSISDFHFCVS